MLCMVAIIIMCALCGCEGGVSRCMVGGGLCVAGEWV
jgi:hypothetical protein